MNGVFDTFITASGASIVTSPVRTGLRAAQLAASAGAPQIGYTIAAGNRVVTQVFYIRFATLPSADVQLAHFVATGGNGYLWFMNTNDKFGVSVTTSGQVEGGPTIVVDTWYRIVLEYDTSANPFVIRCTVDDTTEFSDSSAIAAADITAARLGNTTNATYTAFYDDWIISVTNGDYEDIIANWAEHKIESHIPSSDGTHNIGASGDFDSFTSTAFSNSTTNGNTFIGHRPMQRANTAEQVIRQDVIGAANYMEFGLENMSDNTRSIAGVRAYTCVVYSSTTGTPAAEVRLLLADNTEVLTTGSISVKNSTEDPGTTVTTYKRMTIPPSGGWDGTKVDGLKARVGFDDLAADANFIDFMLEVASFTAPAAGAALQPVVIVVGL